MGRDGPPRQDPGVRVGKSTLHKVANLDGLLSELAVRGYLTALSRDLADVERWLA